MYKPDFSYTHKRTRARTRARGGRGDGGGMRNVELTCLAPPPTRRRGSGCGQSCCRFLLPVPVADAVADAVADPVTGPVAGTVAGPVAATPPVNTAATTSISTPVPENPAFVTESPSTSVETVDTSAMLTNRINLRLNQSG
ncbi:hypothetical protein Asppvi_003284 [Aspergillus pseudoviridinutans]|uniref:Uncharacterized protein n=1 Tax=Aspergillus pseudoviridinutans TaxID=1517512 RepID=A0A9P3B4M9_9EURO|nr:uncharacterized protein Asppvi_003284 [Aspergillus pseudoviridinutans]GIJ84437.1 hypothetical protein Asppvi_003284 [Aspergillus pseudoviridinutans]